MDDKNAVLYCNRAACHLALIAYLEAIRDAEKAIALDPAYSKAWARLASAQDSLELFAPAIKSWQSAINTFTKADLKPAEIKQREQYLSSLEATKRKERQVGEENMRAASLHGVVMNGIGKKMPWDCARELLPELITGQIRSSAIVLHSAVEQFDEAVKTMHLVKWIQTPTGKALVGVTGALVDMSNAILQDKRCFRIGSGDWVEKYNLQLRMENTKAKAPNPEDKIEILIAEFHRLFIAGSWDAVRPAVSITIRSLILKAFIEGGMKKTDAESVRMYDKALAILRWGREQWCDIPREERGTVFDDTFVRGVRHLRLDFYMNAWAEDRNSIEFTLKGLLEESDSIIDEIRSGPAGNSNLAFNMAFYDYIEGSALAMKGFCYNHIPRQGKLGSVDKILDSLKQSAKCYFEAAEKFPQDDELHVWWLNVGLDIFFQTGAPLRETIPIMERIRKAVPMMKRIWEHSSMSLESRDQILQRTLWFEEDVKRELDEGRATLDSQILPDWCAVEELVI